MPPRIPPPPPSAPPPPPPSWAPPSRESELQALRQRQLASSSSHPVLMQQQQQQGGTQQQSQHEVQNRESLRLAELDALRQKGLAKIFNRHFTTAAENIAREREAADLALAELERRKEEIKNNPNYEVNGKGAAGGGSENITMLDNMYMELQKRKSEVKRKERETLELYRRYVNQYEAAGQSSTLASSATQPSPRHHLSSNQNSSSNRSLPAVTEEQQEQQAQKTVQRETDKLMQQMYKQASHSSPTRPKDEDDIQSPSVSKQIKKFDTGSSSGMPPPIPNRNMGSQSFAYPIPGAASKDTTSADTPSSSKEADVKATTYQTPTTTTTKTTIESKQIIKLDKGSSIGMPPPIHNRNMGTQLYACTTVTKDTTSADATSSSKEEEADVKVSTHKIPAPTTNTKTTTEPRSSPRASPTPSKSKLKLSAPQQHLSLANLLSTKDILVSPPTVTTENDPDVSVQDIYHCESDENLVVARSTSIFLFQCCYE